MREYTFLLSSSFRTPHIKAKSLREAYGITKIWYFYQKLFGEKGIKEHLGKLTPIYQYANREDYVMSGWLSSNDKSLKEVS